MLEPPIIKDKIQASSNPNQRIFEQQPPRVSLKKSSKLHTAENKTQKDPATHKHEHLSNLNEKVPRVEEPNLNEKPNQLIEDETHLPRVLIEKYLCLRINY